MGKKRCRDDNEEDLLFPLWEEEDDLIQKILVWLPVKSLLRFKSVCKSWRDLIQSSFFIGLHTTTTTTFNSSSNKFGSFILLASVDKHSSECALIRLSSSETESESLYKSESGSGDWWWSTTGSNDDYDDDDDDDDDITCSRADDYEEDNQPDYDDQVFKVDDDDYDQVVFKLDCFGFPPCYQFYSGFCNIQIVGSCNGLVCLYDKYGHNKAVSLWNPATRQFRILPNWLPSVGHGRGDRNLVAFGFDVETKDYKVVLFTCLAPKWYRPIAPVECLCRVQVYSLSTDSWRLLEGITCLPGYPFFDGIEGEVLYLNGSCFFLAHFLHTRQQPCVPENDRFMISFDLTKEIITPMQLPNHHHRDQVLYLNCLGDKIALFMATCYSQDNDAPTTYEDPEICCEDFDIWVLNEHGSSVNKGSWTRLYSFGTESKIPGQWNIPRGISNDGEFALLETRYSSGVGKKMKLYNLATNKVKKNFLSCSAVMSKANAYIPSLVSITGGNGCSSRNSRR